MYKSYRLIDGKGKWVIVDENGNIINKSPGKEELKHLQIEFKNCGNKKCGDPNTGNYNKTNTCDICGEKLYPRNACRESDKLGNLTGRWLCKNCYERYDPDSQHSARKFVAHHRTGNLDPNSSQGKGDIFQAITVKVHKVKDLNIESNNYTYPIDHSPDPILGILQTKGATYDTTERTWHIAWWREHNKEFDNLIFYCANEDLTIIERVYIFPKAEVLKRKSITITKNPLYSRGPFWYDIYRVDERPYNNSLHNFTVGDFPQFDKEKCKKWIDKVKQDK